MRPGNGFGLLAVRGAMPPVHDVRFARNRRLLFTLRVKVKQDQTWRRST